MPSRINIKEWDRFDKLVILYEETPKVITWIKRRRFVCKCDCWNITVKSLTALRTKSYKSCWCWRFKHWMFWTRFYDIWGHIVYRCNNSNSKWYKNYWWRWIKCLWNSFEEFRDDMYESYLEHSKKYWENNTTIERIDVNWNYCKENCKWATKQEQSRNKRETVRYNNIPIIDLCEQLWLNYNTVKTRINKLWWTIWKALWLEK